MCGGGGGGVRDIRCMSNYLICLPGIHLSSLAAELWMSQMKKTDNKNSTHLYVSPSTTRSSARLAYWIVPSHRYQRQVTTYATALLVNPLLHAVHLRSLPALLFHRQHRAVVGTMRTKSSPCSNSECRTLLASLETTPNT